MKKFDNVFELVSFSVYNKATIELCRETGLSYERVLVIPTDVYLEENIMEISFSNGCFGICTDNFEYDEVSELFISDYNNMYTSIGIHVL